MMGDATKEAPRDAESTLETQGLRSSLVGLALSGGGIRSATFALGFLQALAEKKLLWIFDYLSTVSGGGYVGGWWSAWLSRIDRVPQDGLFPLDERLEPDRFPAILLDDKNVPVETVPNNVPSGTPEGSRSARLSDPIHHLRLFSNYLTPRKGALSADTWRAITIISRNLVLTWLILLPLLVAVVVIGQFYFVSNAEVGYFFVCSRPDSIFVDTISRNGGVSTASSVQVVRHIRFVRRDTTNACKRALALDSAHLIADRARMRSSDAWPQALIVTHGEVLRQRLRVLADPLFAALLLTSVFTLLWMLYGTGAAPPTVVGLAGVAYAVRRMIPAGNVSSTGALTHFLHSLWFTTSASASVLVVLMGIVLPHLEVAWRNAREERKKGKVLDASEEKHVARDRVRNILVQWHARVLILFVVALGALFAAGFAHELTWYLFDPQSGAVFSVARKAGGWAAVAFSVASGLFTILKAGPTSKGKDAAAESPRLPTVVMMAIGPVVVLAAFVVGAATLTRWIFSSVSDNAVDADFMHSATARLTTAALVGIGLLCFFALYERWASGTRRDGGDPIWHRFLFVALPVLVVAGFLEFVRRLGTDAYRLSSAPVYIALGLVSLIGIVRLATTWLEGNGWRLTSRSFAGLSTRQADDKLVEEVSSRYERVKGVADNLREVFGAQSAEYLEVAEVFDPLAEKMRQVLAQQRAHRLQAFLRVVVTAVVADLFAWYWLRAEHLLPPTLQIGFLGTEVVSTLALAGVIFALVFLLIDALLSRRESDRSVALVLGAALTSGVFLTLYNLANNTSAIGFAIVGAALIAMLFSLVTGLGWMADPNLLALHNFYKARLVRAYLGASNATERKDKEITETAPSDDLALKDLKNHERGAPIHIINTTLNLVGGRDLATAQRSAAPFTMSSLTCGSARTGYHRTDEYMGGTLSLGTAIATSGAAVSTNMGSKTISSSLALLLAFFNIRLGLWAPTPNKGRWYESRPRLWPFYLMQEALSQTNDLGAYCYLTDGGHFDNTGLYALVERGCRYIMVLDDGADPSPCFSDMGEAIRRCRIDFGAEIWLSSAIGKFKPDDKTQLSMVHVARGTIQYSSAHLKMLGWSDEDIRVRSKGIIVWIKPVLTDEDSVDVRQYKLENSAFPQQTTADQWYDESQFESYRALGYQAIARALDGMTPAERPTHFNGIETFFDAFRV
jgi:hypothetical protein